MPPVSILIYDSIPVCVSSSTLRAHPSLLPFLTSFSYSCHSYTSSQTTWSFSILLQVSHRQTWQYRTSKAAGNFLHLPRPNTRASHVGCCWCYNCPSPSKRETTVHHLYTSSLTANQRQTCATQANHIKTTGPLQIMIMSSLLFYQ